MRQKHVSVLLFALLLLLPTAVWAAEGDLTNWALGRPYTYSLDPHENYPDSIMGELTDGEYGRASYSDPAWVGHLRDAFRMITIDLGESRSVQEVTVNFLHEESVGARIPAEVILELSTDGVVWEEIDFQEFEPQRIAGQTIPGTDGQVYGPTFTKKVVFSGFDRQATHVRITMFVDVWVFMDEIEVLGK